MSSKCAEAAAGGTRWGSIFGRRSIAAHIALLYTLSAVALLAIVVGLLYWVETRSLETDEVFFLADKVQQLRMALRKHADDPMFLEQEVKAEGGVYASGQHHIFYSRILDETGRVLIETPGAEKVLPAGLFQPPAASEELPEQAELTKAADGRSYLLVSAWGETGGSNAVRRIIQVALDETEENGFIIQYRRVSLLLVFVGILLAGSIGVLVARNGMLPLGNMAQVAERITASHLDERIEPERWPSELTSLAWALDGMLGRLEDSHSRLAQFSADLAHELRTPIQVLMGQTEVALTKERPPEEYRRILESNLGQFYSLTRMINELLFLARAENPKTQIKRTRLDAREELEAIREFHDALAEAQGVTMTCEGAADLYADPLLLRRAVTNLLSNALRHTPRGGRIVLSVEGAEDNGVIVRVSDTGCGIRPEDLPRICDRLYCPDRGSARCSEGTGLGLAIVKSIAGLHGGRTAVESIPGQGTTVILHFPTPAPAAA